MKQLQQLLLFLENASQKQNNMQKSAFFKWFSGVIFAHTLMSNICKVLVMAMNTVFLHLSEEAIKRAEQASGWRKVSRSAILREA